MREILFRGKCIDNSEWISGQYWSMTRGDEVIHFIRTSDFTKIEINLNVDPDTVGQYTGLIDKNGAKIFEGDIIRYTFDDPDDPNATENGLKVRVGRVFWSEWRASFAVAEGPDGSDMINQDIARYVRGKQIYGYIRGANTVEVIGNIYDNPELLGGGGDD